MGLLAPRQRGQVDEGLAGMALAEGSKNDDSIYDSAGHQRNQSELYLLGRNSSEAEHSSSSIARQREHDDLGRTIKIVDVEKPGQERTNSERQTGASKKQRLEGRRTPKAKRSSSLLPLPESPGYAAIEANQNGKEGPGSQEAEERDLQKLMTNSVLLVKPKTTKSSRHVAP